MARSDKWEQCRIEAADNVKSKIEVEGSIRKALSAVSSESGIPVGTLKRWVYPENQKKYEKKRKAKKRVVLSETDNTLNPDTEPVTGNLTNFKGWGIEMEKHLEIATAFLENKLAIKSEEERVIIRECFGIIDDFIRLYIKKRKDKSLPF
jgi:hypothetical protein